MSYRLYGPKRSGAAMVELALAEIGVEYECVRTGLGKGGRESSAYHAINPTGKVPALETPEGDVLTESAAILLTLAERHPGAGLLPRRRGPARASAVRWTVFFAAEVYPMIEIIDYPLRFVGEAEADALRERVRERIRRRWLSVERAIAGDPWLGPRGPTIADLAIGVGSRWSAGAAWRREHCPGIDAIAGELARREPSRAVWKSHFGR